MRRKKPKAKKSRKPISVVTGAAGFLGSHLVDVLLARGHRAVGKLKKIMSQYNLED